MSGDARAACRVVVRGRVQGVFFRDTCRREAAARGVAGYVRNEPDGTVVAEFEGAAAAVDAMIAWVRHGPPDAVVSRVDIEQVPSIGRHDFRVG